ncbi:MULTISPECIES: TylF/MycF/NovP-related O-methyltransferase [unclassified Lentimicrobium]|uniref:TylF/MycF/NovP-related O-methyltransferase n=1 Tax=unclassified Lentimicrobium TaxID=2677434 RepID=UPI001C1323FB|nr:MULTISPECIES: TylF/MycF/NovP-related O-methyltransferase [unclassified Lentimicrobium]
MGKLYINLLKDVLTGMNRMDKTVYEPLDWSYEHKAKQPFFIRYIARYLEKKGYVICREKIASKEHRLQGGDWPLYAETMIGLKRLENIEYCFEKIIEDDIPGDFIETGVWRGGATIFMRALLKEADIKNRKVWVADSFAGLPKPSGKYKEDINDIHHGFKELIVSKEQVKKNFENYRLLDKQVGFIEGWFSESLVFAPINKLSILRLDGDMYESTMDALVNLYPKLSIGGFVIIDDWGAVKACKKAVLDYRSKMNITDPVVKIDWTGVYWRKS